MGLVCDSITGRALRKSKIRFLTQTDQSKITRILVDQKEESWPRVDSSVVLMHHDSRDLGLTCSVKKRKICFLT